MKIKHLAAVGLAHTTYYRQVNMNQSKNAGEQLIKGAFLFFFCGSFFNFSGPIKSPAG